MLYKTISRGRSDLVNVGAKGQSVKLCIAATRLNKAFQFLCDAFTETNMVDCTDESVC